MIKKNLFIALEGIDGSGKSTQVKLLADNLTKEGHKVYTTFEPTKSDMGGMIRNIFSGKTEADQGTIAALFLADRFNHILNKKDGLLKKLEEGYTVITDRYYFSSYAYHSVHFPIEWVIDMNKPCADILRPDITVYIDILPEISMNRILANRESTELFETLENLTNVRNKYLEAFEILKDQENSVKINGDQSPDLIAIDIFTKIVSM